MVEELDCLKMEDPPSFFLKAEDDLENAIPFNQESSKDMLFDLEENSYASNYSKLERTLFGFSSKEGEMEEEREWMMLWCLLLQWKQALVWGYWDLETLEELFGVFFYFLEVSIDVGRKEGER